MSRLHDLPGDEFVGQFTHSVALLGSWQYYTGYCILVSRLHAAELFDLPDEARRGFLDEMTWLSEVLAGEFRPRKLNYELLGNQVPHLHWHLIPRYDTDPEHLQPAWLAIDRADRDPSEHARLRAAAGRSAIAERVRRALNARAGGTFGEPP